MAMKVLHTTCNMCICDFPGMNVLIPLAYILSKSLMLMLQPLHVFHNHQPPNLAPHQISFIIPLYIAISLCLLFKYVPTKPNYAIEWSIL